eukprot:TRINITY_DN77567_c0_g1_i1.p1 TRINITY_DN77567_c0_g1~~TRINITY_DN77567_c0_g1_i1.p1  ORF type:complete len:606 (-),score=123.59 TRINITY_DN77567_c0_g1_i1:208-2025(-)
MADSSMAADIVNSEEDGLFLRQISRQSTVGATEVLKQRRAIREKDNKEPDSPCPTSPIVSGELTSMQLTLVAIEKNIEELCQRQKSVVEEKIDRLSSNISAFLVQAKVGRMEIHTLEAFDDESDRMDPGVEFVEPLRIPRTVQLMQPQPRDKALPTDDNSARSSDLGRSEKQQASSMEEEDVQSASSHRNRDENLCHCKIDLPPAPPIAAAPKPTQPHLEEQTEENAAQLTSAPYSWGITGNRERSALQKNVWFFLEDPDVIYGGRLFQKTFTVLIIISFLTNIMQMVAESLLDFPGIEVAEVVLDCVFMLEVLMRCWASPSRVRFFTSFYNDLDLISALLPLIMWMSLGTKVLSSDELQSLPQVILLALCLLPIMRLLKLLRHFETFSLLIMAFLDALEALPVLLYMLGILVLGFSALIYVFERGASIESFPKAVWFSMVTVSTVGSCDITPETVEGHITVTVLIVTSALYMAIPIGIVGKSFGNVWDNRKHLLILHRLRVRFIAQGYRVQDIPAMFCNFDANADGELSKAEFREMLTHMEIELSTGRAADIFNAFDEDNSGAIDDVEFVKALFPQAAERIYDDGLRGAEALQLEGPEETIAKV